MNPNTQKVQIQFDVTITLNSKYSEEEVRDIVERGAKNSWPNNQGHINSLRFIDERPNGKTWQVIHTYEN